MFAGVEVLIYPIRKLSETVGMWVYRAFKGADFNLVLIARIDHQDFWIINKCIPLLRRGVASNTLIGINIRLPHRNDFALELDLHSQERTLLMIGKLTVQISQTVVGGQVFEQCFNGRATAGHRSVNALPCEQQRSLDVPV